MLPLTKLSRHLKRFFIIYCCYLAVGCAYNKPEPIPPHPLTGKILRTTDQQVLSSAELFDDIMKADIIYLGERHDDVTHHEGQLEIIKHITEQGRKPAIGFETFSVEQTSILMNYSEIKNSSHLISEQFTPNDWLKEKLHIKKEKDKTWEYYGAIINYGFEHQLPLFGIDLNKAIRHRITKKGIEGLSSVEKQLLNLSKLPEENYRQFMHEQFKKGHCGWGKPRYLNKLYDNWLARNDGMAEAITAMADSHKDGPVVVIVGTGHTQFNKGVYDRVKLLNPNLEQLNLAFTNASEDITDLSYYQQQLVFEDVQYGYGYEYRWFTQPVPAAIGENLCKAYLKKKNQQKEKEKPQEQDSPAQQ